MFDRTLPAVMDRDTMTVTMIEVDLPGALSHTMTMIAKMVTVAVCDIPTTTIMTDEKRNDRALEADPHIARLVGRNSMMNRIRTQRGINHLLNR